MIKKIAVADLQVGMYIHDLNLGWLDHNFLRNQFAVKSEATVRKVRSLGVHELYIDTDRGLDVANAPTAEEETVALTQRLEAIAETPWVVPPQVTLADEVRRARKLHGEAHRIVKDMMADIRLGQQIEMKKVEPLVEQVVDSIFRHPDALIPLARLKTHDDYTFLHSVSVCALMVAFARSLNLPRDIIKEVAIGALLHDVGKARVAEGILNKPAKLTEAEFAKMKSHVVQSKIILANTPGVSQIALEVAAQHHERFDGTGYPNRLQGDAISLYGQMGAIVDVYDAITSNRVYHKGMAPSEALKKLLEWSKFHFNPDLVQAFIRSIGIYPSGSLVRLASNRLGVVMEQNEGKLLQPKVRIFYHAGRRSYVEPEVVDLSRPRAGDAIVGCEDPEHWGLDIHPWLPG